MKIFALISLLVTSQAMLGNSKLVAGMAKNNFLRVIEACCRRTVAQGRAVISLTSGADIFTVEKVNGKSLHDLVATKVGLQQDEAGMVITTDKTGFLVYHEFKIMNGKIEFMEMQAISKKTIPILSEPKTALKRNNSFGHRITERRLWLKENVDSKLYRVVNMAKALGVSRSTIYTWENGSSVPEPVKLQQLAEFLKLEEKELEDLIAQDKSAVALPKAVAKITKKLQQLDITYHDIMNFLLPEHNEKDTAVIKVIKIFTRQTMSHGRLELEDRQLQENLERAAILYNRGYTRERLQRVFGIELSAEELSTQTKKTETTPTKEQVRPQSGSSETDSPPNGVSLLTTKNGKKPMTLTSNNLENELKIRDITIDDLLSFTKPFSAYMKEAAGQQGTVSLGLEKVQNASDISFLDLYRYKDGTHFPSSWKDLEAICITLDLSLEEMYETIFIEIAAKNYNVRRNKGEIIEFKDQQLQDALETVVTAMGFAKG